MSFLVIVVILIIVVVVEEMKKGWREAGKQIGQTGLQVSLGRL
jgi:ABC-type uncharacterized transport system permease subunit